VQVFLRAYRALKDSLTDELSAKRIDYVSDAQNRKKNTVSTIPVVGSSFLVDRGGLAALRTVQDTIHLIGILPILQNLPTIPAVRIPVLSFQFYLNDWSEDQELFKWRAKCKDQNPANKDK
jgi:hypothetical protein